MQKKKDVEYVREIRRNKIQQMTTKFNEMMKKDSIFKMKNTS